MSSFVLVRRDAYQDSVLLMRLSEALRGLPGVEDAVVAMGTPHNRELLAGQGYGGPELAAAGAIGAVAPRHVAFVGSQPDGVEAVRHESGPAAAARLRDDGVDVVVLTGVGPMCTRTECVLAHVLEAHGIATVALVAVGRLAERMGAPRALAADFPLGRPLGRPGDPAFQHRVLGRGLALLDADAGPVLESWPEPIGLDSALLLVPIPGAVGDATDPTSEVDALRDAYARYCAAHGRTSVGLAASPDQLHDVVVAFTAIAAGTPWRSAGLPGNAVACALDLRTYYEEAALAIVDAAPGPGAAEAWFYGATATGRVLRAARRALRDAEAPFPIWYYLTTGEE